MKKVLIICFFTAFSPFLFSQNSNDDIIILSLEECINMSVANSYDLKIAKQTFNKANAEKEGAISLYFPKVSVNGSVTYMFNELKMLQNIDGLLPQFNISEADIPDDLKNFIQNGFEQLRSEIVEMWKPIDISIKGAFFAGITLQQPVFAGGRIIAGNKMAKTGIEMATENIKLKKSETIVEAQKIYWLYVSVREKVKLAKSYKTLLEELEKLITNVVNVDMINRNELMKLQVKHNEVNLKLKQAQSGLELSRMALCRMIGVGYETKIIPADTVIEVAEFNQLPDIDAVKERPEYKIMQKIIQMKQQQINLIRGEYMPSVGITATYGYMGNVSIMGIKDKPHNISNIMGVISVPLSGWWEGAKKIKSSETDKIISQLEFEKNSQLMQLEIKQATFNALNSYENVKNAEFSLQQAQENLRISTDRYSVELETVTELMMSQSAWQEAYSNLIDARIDYRIKEIEFLKATGKIF